MMEDGRMIDRRGGSQKAVKSAGIEESLVGSTTDSPLVHCVPTDDRHNHLGLLDLSWRMSPAMQVSW